MTAGGGAGGSGQPRTTGDESTEGAASMPCDMDEGEILGFASQNGGSIAAGRGFSTGGDGLARRLRAYGGDERRLGASREGGSLQSSVGSVPGNAMRAPANLFPDRNPPLQSMGDDEAMNEAEGLGRRHPGAISGAGNRENTGGRHDSQNHIPIDCEMSSVWGDEDVHAAITARNGAPVFAEDGVNANPSSCMEGVCRNAPRVNIMANPEVHKDIPSVAAAPAEPPSWNHPSASFAPSFSEKRPSSRVGGQGLAQAQNGSSIVNVWSRPPVVSFPSRDNLDDLAAVNDEAVLEDTKIHDNVKKFEAAMVGRLFGQKTPYEYLRTELKRRWERFGVFRMIMVSADNFICFFNHVSVRDAVLMGGPWIVVGQVIGLDRWSPIVSPFSKEGFNTLVWVRMQGLPLYFWDISSLARIASPLRDPLWIDAATDRMEWGAYARICIRIDLSKPLRPGIWINGPYGRFFQPLEYEGLSLFFFNCGQVGQRVVNCLSNSSAQTSVFCAPSIPDSNGPQPFLIPVNVVPQNSTSSLEHSSAHGNPTAMLQPNSSKSPSSSSAEPKHNSPDTHPTMLIPDIELADLDSRGIGPWMLVSRRKKPAKPSKDSQAGKAAASPSHHGGKSKKTGTKESCNQCKDD